MKNLKGKYWLLMLVGVVFLGIGYAALTNITFNINGTATAKGSATNEDFKVRFVKFDAADNTYVTDAETKAAVVSSTNGIDAANVTLDVTGDHTATFAISEGFELGDSVTLEYNVVNESEGIPAYIYADVDANTSKEYFRVTKTVADSELTNKGEVTKVTIKVEMIKQPRLDIESGINFTVNLVASTEKTSAMANATSASDPIVYASAEGVGELTSILSDSTLTNVDITLTNAVTKTDSNLVIPAGKNVTLDLNSKSYNGSITVNGNLTVEGNGTFNGKAGTNAFYVTEDAILTINKGSYNTDYNAVFVDGGKVVVNDGTFNCSSLCFSSNANGEYKDFNMEINGGTFNSGKGYNIYIPNPGTLTVNGGTFNGGILYRMATVNINGGEINGSLSTNDGDYDSYQDYYNYSGEPWFGDAITVISGTYEKPAASSATSIYPVLNITNGTIKSTNGIGNAITVLNLGKYEATTAININGGTFSTNASRGTFEIMNANAFADNNNGKVSVMKAYANGVKVNITGGTGLTGVTTSGNYFDTTTPFVAGTTQY